MAEGIVIGNLTIPVIKGDKGDKGNTGEIISISLVLLSPSSTAYAINNGSTTQAQIELGIPKGLSVSTTNINASGELVFTFNDNSTVNVGQVVGKGISEVTVTEEYDFVVTYTDGTSVTACNLEEEILGAINDILESYYTKTEIDEMGFITKEVNNLTNYTLKTNTGSSIELSINNSTYVMTLNLKNSAGTTISTGTIDLPLETMVVGATYDNTNKKIVLTLKNGSTIDVPVADLVSGLQSEINSNNKLSSDLVDDTNHTNKFVTASEKEQITTNATDISNIKDGTSIDSFGDVETALSGKEDSSNKTGVLNSSSTTAQYPHAKAVYDELVERDEEINQLWNDHPDILDNNALPSGTDLTLNGTGDLKMKVDVGGNSTQESLPNEYQQVEYIESTGTQYIDTGVIPISSTRIDIDFAYVGATSSSDSWTPIFGERSIIDDVREQYAVFINKITFNLTINYGPADVGSSSNVYIEANKKYNLKNNQGSFYINDILESSISVSNTLSNISIYPVYLFDLNFHGSTMNRGTRMKLYSCKFYDGDTLIRNYIPCYRKSDNEIGLYDLVTNTFFTNAGTGTFTKGNDTTNPTYKQDINNVEGDVVVISKNSDNTKSNTVTFPLSQGQKLMLGDTLEDDGIHHKRGKIILDGTENWVDYTTQVEGYYKAYCTTKKTNSKFGILTALCTHFKIVDVSLVARTDELLASNQFAVYISISSSIASNSTELKSWLAQQYANNTPVIVEYELETETIEAYTPAQQTAYNKLKEMQSYYDLTYVTGSSDNAQPILTVQAKKSLKVINDEISNINSRLTLLEE